MKLEPTTSRRTDLGLASASLLAGCLLSGCSDPPLEVAPDVDLEKFAGRWHEVAHVARATQNDCTGTTATYTRRSDGSFSFVHECTLTSGLYRGSIATARVPEPASPAKLSVDFGGYVGAYWIVALASDYRYAVVGHPSRDYLWILSRTPEMNPEDLASALDAAKARSFDTNRLEFTPGGPEPKGTPTPTAAYGCAAAPGQRDDLPAVGTLVALAILASRRRSVR